MMVAGLTSASVTLAFGLADNPQASWAEESEIGKCVDLFMKISETEHFNT